MRRGRVRVGVLLLGAALGGAPLTGKAQSPGPAPSPEEQAALQLADLSAESTSDASAQRQKAWQGYAELALGRARLHAGNESQTPGRLSLSLQFDRRSGAALRWVGALRVDHSDPPHQPYPASVLSLQEAYVSWQASEGLALDLGRINARQGLGTGYNPSDFLRAGALRSQIAVDPASIKNNRLGTVMLRVQHLYQGGAFSALLAPKLAQEPSHAGWHADLGASNDRNRWMLSLSQRWSENLQPQFLLFGGEGQPTQLGLNLSSLWGQATVLYGEWAGAQKPTQISEALRLPHAPRSWHHSAATGLRYTAANKLSLTLEWSYNSAAPAQQDWQQLQTQGPAYIAYRQWVNSAQQLSTRSAWGLYANWPVLPGWPQLDLNALLRHNPQDHSQMAWLELRRRWPGLDLALQWQRQLGRPGSEFGSLPQASAWQLSLRAYF